MLTNVTNPSSLSRQLAQPVDSEQDGSGVVLGSLYQRSEGRREVHHTQTTAGDVTVLKAPGQRGSDVRGKMIISVSFMSDFG